MRRVLLPVLMLLALALAMPFSAQAISPEEQLSDPALEQRARGLSQQLRCLVCQNQSIDESDADLARDLRKEVRSQLTDGKSDSDILEAIRGQYGDYVLLKPPVSSGTYLLWSMPVILLLMAGLMFWLYRRGQQPTEITRTDETVNIHSEPKIDIEAETGSEGRRLPRGQVMIGLALILCVSVIAYSQLGRPDITAKPLADRGAALEAARAELESAQAIARKALDEAVTNAARNPKSVDAQLVLALAAAQSGNYAIEQKALNTALSLTDGDPSIKAMMAEALSREADGLVTLPARQLIAEILKEAPEEPRALYLAGLAAFQDEIYETALAYWTELQTLSTANAPWQNMLSENIAQAARAAGLAVPDEAAQNRSGPDAEMLAAAAELSGAEQQEMIRAMVASLEARLLDDPNDVAGWQRLIESRRVLNDRDGLIRALAGAASAFPRDKASQLALLETLLQVDTPLSYRDATRLALSNLRAIDANGLEYLFFNGHFANLRGDTDIALSSWMALQAQLPEDDAFSKRLAAQINALQSE